jgi:serine/threonine protein kinase/predicted Zn-dependent protease
MSLSASGRTWEQASSPAAVRLAQRFEAAWRDATDSGSARDQGYPRPDDFLPEDAQSYPGARLALLRADLALRWEAGERVGAEWYRQHYDDLGEETLVALIYEEFCLREEHDEAPEATEYFERFPEVAAQLRRVLDIHGLVGSASAVTESLAGSDATAAATVVFPEAGQTIAGFHLVEELGRGSFARVFLAQERQLANRLVALKVARAGSREPQTLARLQHTHIVPVHSSRTDPATGLHLLWMPYFGRLTLARVLAAPEVRTARTGAELVNVLDRLASRDGPGRAAGRAALERRSLAEAIAWWGARMAEALDHAHDRGVLHRDIKPSNVLITSDGMPMLLDFNLACEPLSTLDDGRAGSAALGGTLDYMAPEHLEALVEGGADQLDGRTDIYSLGVLLFEALVGLRPFTSPRSAASAGDLLGRAAAERRRAVPRLRTAEREIPAALEVVVRRCLAPEPSDRYATAGELAADLQAVADDRPLPHSREPWPGRARRWVRRRRRPLAVAGVIAATLTLTAILIHQAQLDAVKRHEYVKDQLNQGFIAAEKDDFSRAIALFESAERLAMNDRSLEDLEHEAHTQAYYTELKRTIRNDADRLFRAARPLRFRLIGLCGDLPGATSALLEVLHPFYVLENPNWTNRPELSLLDEPRRERLKREVNEMLFLWVIALDRSCDETDSEAAAETVNRALGYCDKALVFAQPRGPWRALRARLAAWRNRAPGPLDAEVPIPAETSALACFQWGLLRAREGRRNPAMEWFRQAAQLEPSSYWYHYYLAYKLDEPPRNDVHADEALVHYDTAVALEPDAPWVRFCRAQLYRQRNGWQRALDDLHRALAEFAKLPASAQDADFVPKVQLEFGIIHRALGDVLAARKDYMAVIAADPAGMPARAARTNLARIDTESGAFERARAAYDALLAEDPDDGTARMGRALLALQRRRIAEAEADLTEALQRHPDPVNLPDLWAHRATARLLLGRADDAERDVAAACTARPSPAYERLQTRVLLSLGRLSALQLDDPDEVARLPLAGPALMELLQQAADRLKDEASAPTPAGLRALLLRAVLLAALGDRAAETEADRAVALAPLASEVYLVRARIRRRLGRLGAARDDVESGLALRPDEPRLWELRGQLKTDQRDPRGAVADLDRALQLGAEATAHGPRARAQLALGNAAAAARDWTAALSHDPEDPRAFLGRARAFLRLGRWDHARADLEQAAAWTDDWQRLGPEIVLGYARCLPAHPEQLPRVLTLAARTWSSRAIASPTLTPTPTLDTQASQR